MGANVKMCAHPTGIGDTPKFGDTKTLSSQPNSPHTLEVNRAVLPPDSAQLERSALPPRSPELGKPGLPPRSPQLDKSGPSPCQPSLVGMAPRSPGPVGRTRSPRQQARSEDVCATLGSLSY